MHQDGDHRRRGILLEAEPLGAVDDLHGRIWRRVISKEELPKLEREHAVISTKLFAGRTVVYVYSDTAPNPSFEPAEPGLKDVYFSTMAGHIGRRREQPCHRVPIALGTLVDPFVRYLRGPP